MALKILSFTALILIAAMVMHPALPHEHHGEFLNLGVESASHADAKKVLYTVILVAIISALALASTLLQNLHNKLEVSGLVLCKKSKGVNLHAVDYLSLALSKGILHPRLYN